jgi:hypothetical protein
MPGIEDCFTPSDGVPRGCEDSHRLPVGSEVDLIM